MLGNFSYCNPTKLYFGKYALEGLNTELPKYGKNVLLVYGGGSVKKNGIYDKVVELLKANGKEIFEDAGVMPNPTADKLREGVARARDAKADLILAVGGGSVCDYAKAVSVSVRCDEDPWDKYYDRFEDVSCEIVPVGGVLVSSKHPLFGKDSVTKDDLAGERLFVPFRMRDRLEDTFGISVHSPNVFGTHNLLNNAAALVRDNAGVALTIGGATELYDKRELAWRPFEPEITLSSILVWKKYKAASPSAAKFLEFVEHSARL